MGLMKLYGPRGGSTLRPHWLLAEAGVEYEAVPVDMNTDARRRPEFLKMSPAGQVPVLDVDGWYLAESLAINNYLAHKYKPELLGSTLEEQAKVWQWSLWALFNPQVQLYRIMEQGWMKTNDEAIIADAKEKLGQKLAVLESQLEGKKYITGDMFTIADINAGSTMTYAEYVKFDLAPFKNISRWMNELKSRLAFKKAKAE